MSRGQDFNANLDKHKFVVIPTNDVGYIVMDDNGSKWGNWHIDPSHAIMCDRLSVHFGGEE